MSETVRKVGVVGISCRTEKEDDYLHSSPLIHCILMIKVGFVAFLHAAQQENRE